MKLTKSKRIEFRLTTDEEQQLNILSQKEKITPSQYLRNIIKNQSGSFVLSEDQVEDLKKNFANLTRMGSNINQIAYHLNKKALSSKNQEEIISQQKKEVLQSHLSKASDQIIDLKQQIIKLITNHN